MIMYLFTILETCIKWMIRHVTQQEYGLIIIELVGFTNKTEYGLNVKVIVDFVGWYSIHQVLMDDVVIVK